MDNPIADDAVSSVFGTSLSIEIDGQSKDWLSVEGVVGFESINQPYEYRVDLLSRAPIDAEGMLGRAATVTVIIGDERLTAHGVVDRVEIGNATPDRYFRTSVFVVPELAMLKHSGQNQIYGTENDVNVIDIIDAEMRDGQKSASTTAENRTPRRLDYEILADSSIYPKREFVMQYRESDLNFVSRLCEKYGIFYTFDHRGDRDVVRFCDRKEHCLAVSGRFRGNEVPYRSASDAFSSEGFAIHSFKGMYRTAPGVVQLREYNQETPRVDLSVSRSTSYEGSGVLVEYGQNYRTTKEGAFLAERRVEELECRYLQFEGESNLPLLRAGQVFKLTDHPDSGLDGSYIVTEVDHSVFQSSGVGHGIDEQEPEPYRNRFKCVPYATGFRPERRTRIPVVNGFLIAFIEGDSDDGLPSLDDNGRYRIRFLDDESNSSDGFGSHRVRKMEGFGGGDGKGLHAKLPAGTEILVGFRHGDPDRPFIAGALSNAENGNPVTATNKNVVYRFVTPQGIIHQMSDGIS
ncbi:MAG: type VI secretion system tip protein TssI/VgrG [Pseudomonadota bacterium]